MKITEILEAVNRPMPKTDLRVGDHVVADTSKEQYPGGHKSRSGKVTRVGQTGVHIQPDDGGEREYHPYKIVKKTESMAEGKAAINFDADDLKRLEKIRDLSTLKAQAFELISKPSAKPMKPEKVEWFRQALSNMNSPIKVIKLMYDLLLSGEGHSVVGTKTSMDPNNYRQRFGEQGVDEAATAGATSSGSIATVVNPGMTNKNPAAGSPGKMAKKSPPQWMPKKQTPKDNALDKNVGLMTGTPIRR